MNRLLIIGLALLCFGTRVESIGSGQSGAKPQPVARLNEQLTTAAWKAHDKGNFREAFAKADKCIKTFEAAAVKLQAKLKSSHADVPKGAVSEEQKKLVNQNGLLNDVATCYLIKGKALEGLKKKDDAISAYKAATKFTYARTWDPQGWFWSPAEAAEERLGELR